MFLQWWLNLCIMLVFWTLIGPHAQCAPELASLSNGLVFSSGNFSGAVFAASIVNPLPSCNQLQTFHFPDQAKKAAEGSPQWIRICIQQIWLELNKLTASILFLLFCNWLCLCLLNTGTGGQPNRLFTRLETPTSIHLFSIPRWLDLLEASQHSLWNCHGEYITYVS